MSTSYIKQVSSVALGRFDEVISLLGLSGGKKRGREYLTLNPKRKDSSLGSFSINMDKGQWSDFSTGDQGGDLVALAAFVWDVKQGEAAGQLGDGLGIAKPEKYRAGTPIRGSNARPSSVPQVEPVVVPGKPVAVCLMPVPGDAPPAPTAHHRGKPSGVWAYRAADGSVMFYHWRFDAKVEGDKKQFSPLTLWKYPDGRLAWEFKAPPKPRPAFGLYELAARRGEVVCIVEGEKAADAAAQLLPSCVVMTWQGGALALDKTDWKPLKGAVVWLWPDVDEPGKLAMEKLAVLLQGVGAASVHLINIDCFTRLPDSEAPFVPLEKGDDAADLVARGWASEHMASLIDTPEFLTSCADSQAISASPPADAGVNTAPKLSKADGLPHFFCDDRGVWHFGQDQHGEESPPLWICSSLKITASTRDAKNESWGRLLEFDDPDGNPHAWAMPMEMLKGDGSEYRGMLLSMGLQVGGSVKAKNLLTQYIQTEKVDKRARCVDRTGWHGTVFVMPSKTIGEADERVLYQAATATAGTFKSRGSLTDWKNNISALCVGNSRLLFSVSTAFAAPLLHLTGMESGGVHLRGDSSTGKTTALRVAASVWGGLEYLQRWRATDNGLEALSVQHSDCLLVLDELGQVDPKAAGEAAYMLANGAGKARANRGGGLRDPSSWRILFISSGEAGLSEHMAEAKKKPKAGQEIRLLDIPADAGAGFGMFEDLHQYAGGAVFSKAITDACGKNFGTAAEPFLLKLIDNSSKVAGWVKNLQREFSQNHVESEAGGQVHRAALRFALIGAAGELATNWNITGWQPGEAMQAAATCFKAWIAQRGGAGNLEELNMMAQVRRFFELHGEARFTDWDRPASDTESHAPRTIQRAGYRRHIPAVDVDGKAIYLDSGDSQSDGGNYAKNDDPASYSQSSSDGKMRAKHTRYYVFPEVFKSEICSGFDYRVICKIMIRKGSLIPDGKGFTKKVRLAGDAETTHCFVVTHKLWEGGEAEN